MSKRRSGDQKVDNTDTQEVPSDARGWHAVEEEPPVSRKEEQAGSRKKASAWDNENEPLKEKKVQTASIESAHVGAGDAVRRARSELEALTGYPIDAVSGFVHTDEGWLVTIEMLELNRIPPTTDVLGTYEVVVDDRGELVRYARLRRYYRNQIMGE